MSFFIVYQCKVLIKIYVYFVTYEALNKQDSICNFLHLKVYVLVKQKLTSTINMSFLKSAYLSGGKKSLKMNREREERS